MKRILISALLSIAIAIGISAQDDAFTAIMTGSAVTIDGIADEPIWAACDWYNMTYVWIPYNQSVAATDFTGRFKISWDAGYLYFLVEVVDDSLYDGHTNPVDNYWNDDCVEVFLDEDKSGGDHLNNFNAFAYHVSQFYDVVDNNTSGPALFNDDIEAHLVKNDSLYTWELAIKVFADNYVYGGSNTPVTLTNGKIMGFSIAYCDNDGSAERENFIGSKYLPQAQANNTYINADIFGSLTLLDTAQHTNNIKISNSETPDIFPTIAQKQLNIKLPEYYTLPVNISIKNISGIEIYQGLVTSEITALNIESLEKGNYIITFNNTVGQFSKYFIKQ